MNTELQNKTEQFKQWVTESQNIVFLGGAGVSTESDIPDFRSADGLYQKQQRVSPEEILSHTFFMRYTQAFYEFYREHMLYPNAKPNVTHYALAKLEQTGKLQAVITQNIDGLHQKAGSKVVYELHGSVYRNTCMRCKKHYMLHELPQTAVPYCTECGGLIKPNVVLYEEPLEDKVWNNAIRAIKAADMLIVGGTSLSVYPAAGLIRYFSGEHLVLINKSITQYDIYADLVIHDSLGNIFAAL